NTHSIVSSMHQGISQVGVASASQPRDRVLPVLPAQRDLFPYGGLQRGSVVAVPGSGLLSLAIAAGASAAGVGVEPSRLLLVAEPGRRWPQVTAALLDGCEMVLLRPPSWPAGHVQP